MVDIIVADDDIHVRELLSKMLKNEISEVNCVYQARNGKDAIELLKNKKIDIVISDIKMPIMDGITMCQNIRSFNETVKIILISAYVEFKYAKEAMRYAVSDYIIKPIDRNEFDKLKKMIIALAQYKERKLSFYLSLHEKNLRHKVKSSLLNEDENYLFNLLDQMSIQSEGDVFLVKEYLMLFIDGVFDYIDEIGFGYTEDSKRNAISALVSYDSSEACILYVADLIANTTQFTPKSVSMAEAAKNVKNIIDSSYNNENQSNLNVNELAERQGISRIQLSTAFKKEYGVPLVKYIVEAKMKYAGYLLRNTDYSVAKIAEILGYSDFSGFKRMFRKYSSKLPSEYRTFEDWEE